MTSHTSARNGNSSGIATWFAGSPRLSEIVVKALDAFEVPTYPQSAPTPAGEIGRYYQFAPAMQVMTSGFVWHSDHETAETISSAGLAAITRAYAKVMTLSAKSISVSPLIAVIQNSEFRILNYLFFSLRFARCSNVSSAIHAVSVRKVLPPMSNG